MHKVINEYIDKLIDLAIAEDIGDGDHSSLSCIPENEEWSPSPISSSIDKSINLSIYSLITLCIINIFC